MIEVDNVQTPKNVARIIENTDAIKAFEHTEGTVYEYTRLRMLSMFGKRVGEGGTHGGIIDKIWCRVDLEHNIYIPLDDETVKEFCELFGAIKESSKDAELELLNDYQIGLITRDDLIESIGSLGISNYLTARKEFKKKYGYYPLKVPIYALDGLDIIRFEKGENLGFEGIGTHSFRKWYATEIYKANGYDIALVQRLLQHSSAAVTQRYIGIEPQRIEEAILNHVDLL